MELSCSCGNKFNFGEYDEDSECGDIKGFEVTVCEEDDGNSTIVIQCNKCGNGIILHSPEEVVE